jgi:hypothetical protein
VYLKFLNKAPALPSFFNFLSFLLRCLLRPYHKALTIY